jgi:hypothetical protein
LDTYTIGGTVSGLTTGQQVTLLNNGGDATTVTGNGTFTFPTPVVYGGTYAATVGTQPTTENCTVTNGNSNNTTANISNVSITCSAVPVFPSSPSIVLNLNSYAPQMCGTANLYNTSQIIPIDLNHDGKMDLLVSLWCTTVANNATSTAPDISYLIAFLQNSDGTFTDGTAQIFGSAPLNIGASTSPGYLVSDFNGDGYPDVVFGLNREDGRGTANNSRLSYNYALLSNGNSGYTVSTFGALNYASEVIPVDNSSGGQDFVIPSFANSPFRYSYSNGSFSSTEYDFVSTLGTTFLSRTSSTSGSTSAIVSNQNPGSTTFGVSAWNYVNGAWAQGGSYNLQATLISESQNGVIVGTTQMVTINGNNYAFPDLSTNCLIKRTPTGAQEVMYDFNSQQIIGGYTGQAVTFGNSAQLQESDQLLSFSNINGAIVSNSFTYSPQLPSNLQPNKIVCNDINGDGYSDIYIGRAVNSQSTVPVIYINDKSGNFKGVNSNTFPTVTMDGSEFWDYLIADINGDGIPDLIYYQIVSMGGTGNPVQLGSAIKIYYGNRLINSTDLSN